MFLLTPPLVALVGALLLALLRPRSRTLRSVYTEIVTLGVAVCAWILILGKDVPDLRLAQIAEGYVLSFRLDDTSRIFAGLVSFLWPMATLYAFDYMTHEERENTFFVFYTLSFAVTLLLAFAANLFTLYCCYELLTLATLPLVAHKQDAKSRKAGLSYLTYTVGGATLGLLALMFLSGRGDLTSFTAGGVFTVDSAAPELLRFFFVLGWFGFSVKAAVFPLHAWLPRASVAPTPVTALLHAVAVVNAGAFASLRFIYHVMGTDLLAGSWAQTVVLSVSAFTVAFGAVMAVREQHLKRRLAWSTVSNLNYILFSATLMSVRGATGAFAHMVFHGLMKITLFYCAGAILVKSGREYLRDLNGMKRSMPFITVIFTIAGIALMGIPPFAGFLSKWEILNAAMDVGSVGAWLGSAAILLSSILSAVYLLSVSVHMIFMEPTESLRLQPGKDPGLLMKFPLIVLTLLILFASAYATPLMEFFSGALL